ncbi:uncharacterized protein LOC141686329 [Apium graveolens]|uniref:uncharacterized protein LOC141686329 n=1 Tax=Apium graveolens TaxID=4045 RepID=UPI003D791788
MDNNKAKGGGSIGLSYPTLTKNNYTSWALKMKVYLQARGVWIAIEPNDPKAAVEEKTYKVALAMMYQGLPEDMLLSITEKETAKQAWDALKTMCQGAERVKKAKVQTLRTEFESMSMKDNEQLDDLYLKLNGLVSNIRALGESINNSYVVKKLLRAVPSKFLHIVSTLEQFGDLETMTLEEAVGSLKAHKEKLKGSGKTESNEDWLRRSNRRNTDGSSFNPKGRGRDKSNLKCYNCSAYGHFAADCRKPRRIREQKEEVNMTRLDDNEPALLLAKSDKKEQEVAYLS